MLKTRPVSSKLAFGTAPKILSSRMDEISAEADALAWLGADVDNFWAKTPMEAACLPTWKKDDRDETNQSLIISDQIRQIKNIESV